MKQGNKHSIGMRLRSIRLAAGLTQQQVAEKIDRTQKSLTSVETGVTKPDIRYIAAFANACGYAVEWNFTPKGTECEELTII